MAVADAPAAWGAPDLPPGCARWWSSRSRCGGSWAARCGSGARPQRATAPPRWVALLRFLKGWRDGGPWVEWNSHADSSAARRCGRGPSAGASLVARRWSGGRRSRGALPAGWCCAPWDIRQDIAASSSSSTASSRRRPRGRGRAGAALSSSRRSPSALSPTAAASPTAGLPRCLPYSSLLLPSRPFAPDPAVARAPLLRRRAAAWVARRPQATGARRPAAFGRSRCFPGLRVDF